METGDGILNDIVDSNDLKNCEDKFNKESLSGKPTNETTFNYAWCLIRSKYQVDIRKGIKLFEKLYAEDPTEEGKRSFLYFMAVGYARIKNYVQSLKLIESFLSVEPNNSQIKDLEVIVKRKLKKEGLEGIAVAGTAALVLGGLVGLGLALRKSK